ncbi:glycosyltransferase family 9 protein [Desulfuromonas carbonis]|uniref:glycosyltransferase family 9 protein n=1 Tax=Desulfuromonas sp. DDH964 TaxID=1823759 RepID=UPI00078E255A|nr:glycosyltransferase family 9 protein [Desulfuromonas sp. DDH964]AMV72654.1 ADP-heptose--lipopolysaccharide heptosyltransferase [Desulfuromonas sp. DDH964]
MKTPIDLPADSSIRRILVLKWSAMGDVVISSALFEDIRRAFPAATLDLHTLPPWAGLFRHDPRFAEVCTIDVRRKQGGLRGLLAWLRFVRSRRYDLIVDLQSNDRSRSLMTLLKLTGAAPRHLMGNHRRFPYTLAPEPAAGVIHAFDLQQETLRVGGIPTVTPRPVLYPGPEHLAHAQELQRQFGLEADNYAVLLPGSQAAGRLKRWGWERYAALAGLLHQRGLAKVVLLGGPDEIEECARIADRCGSDWLVNLCGQTQILELVPLCAGARLIVANDTGTAHVASATPTPMVVICGPTDPLRVKPVGENVVALQTTGLACINCYCKAPCEHHSCMVRITPEMVLARLPEGLIAGRS